MNGRRAATGPSGIFWLLILLALIAYVLPWIETDSASMRLGAYDLAEWASLHPAARNEFPSLLPSFLLRLQLVLWAIMIVVNKSSVSSTINRRLQLVPVLILILAQLPPSEFFLSNRADPNYQQQFMLAGLSILGVILGRLVSQRYAIWISILLSSIGLVTTVVGLSYATRLMQQFSISSSTGLGGVIVIAVYILLLAYFIFPVLNRRR